MKVGYLIAILAVTTVLFSATGCQNKKGPESVRGLNRIHFDFDSASISSDMSKTMDNNALYLKKHDSLRVIIEGHCDERGTNEYNLALGDRRANSAKDFLTRKGIDSDRIRTVSYGEERPLESGHDEAAWYMNRRADFVRQ